MISRKIFCQHKNTKKIASNLYIRSRKSQEYSYLCCQDCGLVFINPIPSESTLEALYKYTGEKVHTNPLISALYNKFGIFSWLSDIFIGKVNDFSRINEIKKMKTKGRLLDVGCGPGNFLYALKDKGFELYGTEVSHKVGTEARRLLDKAGKVHIGQLKECNFKNKYFDVITLWHVFEHIPNLEETMKEIKRILKPGGILVIETPNADSFNFRLFGEYWTLLMTPEHLYFWNKKSFHQLFKTYGLKVISISYPFLFPFFFLSSFLTLLRDKYRVGFRLIFLPAIAFIFPISIALSIVFSLARKSDIIRIVVLKP